MKPPASASPTPNTKELRLRQLAAAAPFALVVAMLAPFHDYVPVFDGRIYANCITTLARHPSWDGLVCANHPTHAYMTWSALVAAIAPYRPESILLGHVLLFCVGLWAFRRLVAQLFPNPERWWEPDALTALLAVHPVMLSATLNPEPGLATAAFALGMVEGLVARKYLRAGAFALLLAFTKEIGDLLLVAFAAAYAVLYITRILGGTVKAKLAALNSLWPIAAVLLLLGVRFYYLTFFTMHGAVATPNGSASGAMAIASEFLSFRPLDRTFLSFAAGVLVLQFQWVLAAVILAWVLVALGRWALGLAPLEADPERRRHHRFLLLLFAAAFYLTTRYRTFSNVRYMLACYPFMLLAAYAAVRELRVSARPRLAAVAVLFVLWAVSARATIDPLSKKVYGTFEFGSHTMLDMNSITAFNLDRFHGGRGRDELIYNLQSAYIDYLQDAVQQHLASVPHAPAIVDVPSNWMLWDSDDPSTHQRTLNPSAPEPDHIMSSFVQERAPAEAYFVRYPNFSPTQDQFLTGLMNVYDVTDTHTVDVSGYQVQVLKLKVNPERWHAWFGRHGSLGFPTTPSSGLCF